MKDKNQKKYKRFVSLTIAVLAVLTSFPLAAEANSAQRKWEGTNVAGAVIKEGECPVIVEKEVLTFDIPEFPKQYYADAEEYLAYSAKVTAEYTFYNPSEYRVTASLFFPFGNEPEYADSTDDIEKYDIFVQGKAIEKKIRYSFASVTKSFDLEQSLAKLQDEYREDVFYVPDMTVTEYHYAVSGVDCENYRAATAAVDIKDGTERKFYFAEQSGFHMQKDGKKRISTWIKNEGEYTVYVFGEPLQDPLDWKFYKNGAVEDTEEIAGTMTLKESRTITLYEFAMANYDDSKGISEIDWYNAVIAEMKEAEINENSGILCLECYAKAYEGALLRWYEYEITIEPEGRIVNTVTAPLYPNIDATYEPEVYYYTYLLSPAKTWKAVWELEVIIRTPYHMTLSNLDGLIKVSDGYHMFLDGLPDGEFQFAMSTSAEPKKAGVYNGTFFGADMVRGVIFAVGIVLTASGLYINLKKNKRKKKD